MPCITVKYKDDGGINFMEMFTIDHQGAFYLLWNFMVTIACLVSSYMYVALAAFRTDDALIVTLVFEGIFVIDIIINFMLSYERNDTA